MNIQQALMLTPEQVRVHLECEENRRRDHSGFRQGEVSRPQTNNGLGDRIVDRMVTDFDSIRNSRIYSEQHSEDDPFSPF